ncbi:MAG: extracellular solute-binding protein [Clostridiales Family XIII bacterium]|nr:extracellular solute-binding protein [Clostridiales Family XIII bacterium]
MKKLLVFVLAIAMTAVFALGACTGDKGGSGTGSEGGGGEGTPAGGIELRVVTSYGGDDGNRTNYENAFHAWEDATGNSVSDDSATSNEEWKGKVNTDFETGTEPDVLFFFTNNDSDNIVNGGKVVSLEEIRAEYPDYGTNLSEELLPVSPADGKKYALPSTGFWEALFVNKKILEEVGVPIPGADYTMDQFIADCQKVKDAGYTPIAASLQEVPHYWWEFEVFNNGSPATHLTVPAEADDAAGKTWAAGMDDLKTLYDKGFFPENTLTAKDADTVQLMFDGEAAFLIDGSWKVGAFLAPGAVENVDDFAVTYVPGKGERKATDIIGGISMGYYITKQAWDDTEKREAAVSFIQHMTSDEVLASFGANGAPTAVRNAAKDDAASALVASAQQMFVGQTSMTGAVQDLLQGPARDALFAGVKNVVTGGDTPEKLLKKTVELNVQ